MTNIIYYILFALWYCASLLPLRLHYLFSSGGAWLLYNIIRYRRKVVRENLVSCFPEMSEAELQATERKFYSHMCDLIVESLKFFSISRKEMRRRMRFEGLEAVERSCRNGQSCAVYLGHYANWEWVSSLQLWLDPEVGKCVQLYHPLENKVFDRLVGYTRERMGSTSIPVSQSVRHMVKYRREGKPLVIGFIADQVPMWQNIHLWTDFLNHPQTPVFTGPERLARQFDMDVYHLHVTRESRGHYVARFELIAEHAKQTEENALSILSCQKLEEDIRQAPAYWLWSHRRWKRTYDEWVRIMEGVAKGEIIL